MKPIRYKKFFPSSWFAENRFIFQDAINVNVFADNGEVPEEEKEQQKSAREKVVSVLDDLSSNDAVQKSINDIIELGQKDLDQAIARFQSGLKQLARCWSETNEGRDSIDVEVLKDAVLTDEEADMITFIEKIDSLADVIRICNKAGFPIKSPKQKQAPVAKKPEAAKRPRAPEKQAKEPMRTIVIRVGDHLMAVRGVFKRDDSNPRIWKRYKSSETYHNAPNAYTPINMSDVVVHPSEGKIDKNALQGEKLSSREPYDGIREAINEDGRVFKGYFILDGPRQYKWYRPELDEDPEKTPNQYAAILIEKLDQLPRPVREGAVEDKKEKKPRNRAPKQKKAPADGKPEAAKRPRAPEKQAKEPMRTIVIRVGDHLMAVRGVFKRDDADRNVWKHWNTSEDYRKAPNAYRTINMRDIVVHPTKGKIDKNALQGEKLSSREPYDGIREAVNEDGRVFKGYFVLDGTSQYKWYRPKLDEDPIRMPNIYTPLSIAKLQQLPRPVRSKREKTKK